MGQPVAVLGDNAMHDAPHCHAPIHPPAPTPTPAPHPPIPLSLIGPGCPTVLAGGKPVLVLNDQTIPCMVPPCVPGGPGMIVATSTVMAGGKPVAKLNDVVTFASCVAPIPSPTGKVIGPGCPTVIVA